MRCRQNFGTTDVLTFLVVFLFITHKQCSNNGHPPRIFYSSPHCVSIVLVLKRCLYSLITTRTRRARSLLPPGLGASHAGVSVITPRRNGIPKKLKNRRVSPVGAPTAPPRYPSPFLRTIRVRRSLSPTLVCALSQHGAWLRPMGSRSRVSTVTHRGARPKPPPRT